MADDDIPDQEAIRAAIQKAVGLDDDDNDGALIKIDLSELIEAVREISEDLKNMDTRITERLKPLEDRIATLEEKLAKGS